MHPGTRKVAWPRSLREKLSAAILRDRGDHAWAKNDLRRARRLFVAAAGRGDPRAFSTAANFLDEAWGGPRDERAALFWYRLAARRGDRSAANNIGCIWRDRGKPRRALRWFERAVALGDADANLNIADIYLKKGDRAKARIYLNRVRRSPWVTEQSKQQAAELQRQLRAEARRSPGRARGPHPGLFGRRRPEPGRKPARGAPRTASRRPRGSRRGKGK